MRAKSFAQSLAKNSDFLALYAHDSLYYLECGIMEAYDAGLEICEGNDNALSQNAPQNNVAQSQHLSKSQKAQSPQESNPLIAQTIATLKQKYLSTKKAWVVTFSGGKDSTCVLQLVYEMLFSLPPHLRRPTYAIASNTLVEAPHIDRFLHAVIDSINAHAKAHNIPFEVIIVEPSIKDDFWVNLIGKGYPSPTRTFRWCTERLKINPAKAQVAQITQKFGSCILLLGSRKAESTNRKKSIEKRILNEDGYSQHHDFPDTLTYSPIAEWDTDSVWGYLLSHKPLWDKDHSELFALYSKASGDECQFITDLAQSSCGGSRFGCWVCTVVNEDKSMQGFISTGEAHLKPLNEFRNYIKDLREDSNARADYKRDGRAVYKVGGLGPFLSHIRVEMLERLLVAEREFLDFSEREGSASNARQNLISDAQLLAIQSQWSKDFDLSHTAITIAQKFHRLKGVKMEKSNILHKEILDEVVETTQQEQNVDILDSASIANLITKSIEICKTRKHIATFAQIKSEIEKLVDDKTTKEQSYTTQL
ncbi:DNA phosphorothioation system sulfurtransferase DndC [Helicobacter sp. T3_23-1056]